MDTIFALATAPGRAGVAVIRISGPQARAGVEPLVGSFGPARTAVLRKLRIAGEVVDQGLVLWFPADGSFTGEEVIELQLHGGPAVVRELSDHLATLPGFRPADAGEFTRRALENGRLDLAQVEGLSDLLMAETAAQRRQAMRVFDGELGDLAEGWRRDLVTAAAHLTAVLDFADEDVPEDVQAEVMALIAAVRAGMQHELDGFAVAERLRSGFEVAIVGAPNAGKSTLLNWLAGREVALTSEIAGTTRDVIEIRLDINGLAVTFLDTAGMRVARDPIEALGVERAINRAEMADLRIFLHGGEGDAIPVASQPGDIVLEGKGDLRTDHQDGVTVSGLTGAGVSWLVAAVGDELASRAQGSGLIAHQRQRGIVAEMVARLDAILDAVESGEEEEITAERLRGALDILGQLTGRTGVEDILDIVFSSFCIGK